MKREWEEERLTQFLRAHRPAPPAAAREEYVKIVAAANRQPANAAWSGWLRHLPWAFAAGVVMAVALSLTPSGDSRRAENGERDVRIEAFLSDTFEQVMPAQPVKAAAEPLNGWGDLVNGGEL